MTTRHLNYTGRERIRRRHVAVTLDPAERPLCFRLYLNLESYRFPDDARVVVEAQAHWTVMRFECGTIAAPLTDVPLELNEFESREGIRFRVKVIGSGEHAGLILGEADGVRPTRLLGESEAPSFLAVQAADLGHVPRRLSFAGPEPLLLVSDRLGDWRSFMSRPEVQALVIPEVFRQLLLEALDRDPD